MPMTFRTFPCAAVLVLTACSTGYIRKDGTIVWKTYDEASYAQVHNIKGIDAASFVKLSEDFGRDKNHVYFRNYVSDADPATFVVLADNYGKDSTNAYFQVYPLAGAEVSSFQVIHGTGYARDSREIYRGRQGIGACDAGTFEFLSNGWQRDAQCVYYNGRKLEGADAQTFQPVGYEYVRDRNGCYRLGDRADCSQLK